MTPSIKDELEQDVTGLTARVLAFATERDWGQFHDPKNLAMALAAESGELIAILRWVSGESADEFLGVAKNREAFADEIGDVAICLLLLCARTNISFTDAVISKLKKNAAKYPAAISRGKADPPAL